MTRYVCNFVPMYKTYIETKHENRDRLGLSVYRKWDYMTERSVFPVWRNSQKFIHGSYASENDKGVNRMKEQSTRTSEKKVFISNCIEKSTQNILILVSYYCPL